MDSLSTPHTDAAETPESIPMDGDTSRRGDIRASRRVPIKPPGRQGSKATGRPPASKIKKCLNLSERAAEMLGIYAIKMHKDECQVVEELILKSCSRFVVSDRGTAPDTGEDRQTGAA